MLDAEEVLANFLRQFNPEEFTSKGLIECKRSCNVDRGREVEKIRARIRAKRQRRELFEEALESMDWEMTSEIITQEEIDELLRNALP